MLLRDIVEMEKNILEAQYSNPKDAIAGAMEVEKLTRSNAVRLLIAKIVQEFIGMNKKKPQQMERFEDLKQKREHKYGKEE